MEEAKPSPICTPLKHLIAFGSFDEDSLLDMIWAHVLDGKRLQMMKKMKRDAS